jgi:hypothetical protein
MRFLGLVFPNPRRQSPRPCVTPTNSIRCLQGVAQIVAGLLPNMTFLARNGGLSPEGVIDSEQRAVESGNLLNRCKSVRLLLIFETSATARSQIREQKPRKVVRPSFDWGPILLASSKRSNAASRLARERTDN